MYLNDFIRFFVVVSRLLLLLFFCLFYVSPMNSVLPPAGVIVDGERKGPDQPRCSS